ncbi:hypothetical protein EJ110_NYTH19038 [Nymphaea thermarum]|nr:hypothetical protein EJ110_NYTH19038 [Nymphaea thermarum]
MQTPLLHTVKARKSLSQSQSVKVNHSQFIKASLSDDNDAISCVINSYAYWILVAQNMQSKTTRNKFSRTALQVDIENAEEMERDLEEPLAYSPELRADEPTNELEEDIGSYSPELLHGEEDEEGINPEHDRAELEKRRVAVLQEHRKRLPEAAAAAWPALADESMDFINQARAIALKAMGAMEEGGAVFGSGAEVYWWHDKYRPRKPKYFNRVHTGYEWNKYNQTHYDHDNPPPKIVQGYKFNIFYPDLVDKTKAPEYKIEKDDSNGETCLIRFHAGPPYGDITETNQNNEGQPKVGHSATRGGYRAAPARPGPIARVSAQARLGPPRRSRQADHLSPSPTADPLSPFPAAVLLLPPQHLFSLADSFSPSPAVSTCRPVFFGC